MTRTWDAIVVGGGIVGLATAYALKQGGAERTLLLERHTVGGATTSRGTGAVQVHRFSRPDLQAVVRSKELMDEISARVGSAFTYYQVGRLTLASGEDADDLRALIPLAEECGVPVRTLAPDEARAIVPGIDVSDVDLATYSELDGRIYSNTLASALAGIARDAGVTIWEGVDAQGIAFGDDGNARGVAIGHDDRIELRSPVLVIAGGAWTRNLLEDAGLPFPTRKRIARTTTVLIDSSAGCEVVPTFMDTVHQLTYIPRSPSIMQLGGHHAGIGVPAADELTAQNPALPTGELMAGFDHMRRCLIARMPGWSFGPILGGWSGLIDVSPDGQPLIGRYPGVSGLWINDTAGYGLMRALAAGEAVAAAILDVEPQVDISPWSLDRFDTLAATVGETQVATNAFRGIGTVSASFLAN